MKRKCAMTDLVDVDVAARTVRIRGAAIPIPLCVESIHLTVYPAGGVALDFGAQPVDWDDPVAAAEADHLVARALGERTAES